MVKNPLANAGDMSSIPGQEAKIPHASRPKNPNIKQKQYCNKFNTDFKNGPCLTLTHTHTHTIFKLKNANQTNRKKQNTGLLVVN